ncbi:helix-turn-helix domain-containing protein [Desulfolutivibrio sulfoxidireducens]|nr:helix-turn-helix domain-containing protein [Desulfolutivibrio sulfoxidireducens]QLA21187.1 helix-turn-helix domain-containing protein [Desulfolutivibrio sulfoxidireducens]
MTKNSSNPTGAHPETGPPPSARGDNPDPLRPVLADSREIPPSRPSPPHCHFRGQLVHASAGVMTITTPDGIWVTPPHLALWVPSMTLHHVRVYGRLSLKTLYILPEAAPHMPLSCRVVPVSPLLRELIVHACAFPRDYDPGGPEGRVMAVILDQMRVLPVAPLYLPMPRDPRLSGLCRRLLDEPGDRRTLPELAAGVGAADRTLLRLFLKETGLTFRIWRRQATLLVALRKLAAGESVTAVALDLGYESQSAFIAMFRRALGVTPGRYFART